MIYDVTTEILETKKPEDPFYIKNAKIIYKLCMNTSKLFNGRMIV